MTTLCLETRYAMGNGCKRGTLKSSTLVDMIMYGYTLICYRKREFAQKPVSKKVCEHKASFVSTRQVLCPQTEM